MSRRFRHNRVDLTQRMRGLRRKCLRLLSSLLSKRYGWSFFLHTRGLEHVGPFAASTSMTMLQMLSKVIGPEELLALVAFSKFVNLTQMFGSCIPVRRVRKFKATEPTNVHSGRGVRGRVESSVHS